MDNLLTCVLQVLLFQWLWLGMAVRITESNYILP